MRIERRHPGAPRHARRGAAELGRSPEQRLVDRREEKRRTFRGHWHAYLMVMLGLMVMNVGTWLLTGFAFPWFLFPAAGWGIGFGIHALNHRAWLTDDAPALAAAERALGLEAPHAPALPAGRVRAALPASTDPFARLVAQCKAACDKAEEALLSVDSPAAAFEDAIERLHEGLRNVEHLEDGAARIDAALAEIARRAKVEVLHAARERRHANGRGFLLATENLRLDAARLGTSGDTASLHAPLERLSDEVEVLRKVEAELATLTR